MKSVLSQVAAAVAGLWLASLFVPGVIVKIYPDSSFFGLNLTEQWQILLLLGIILGLLNFFIKPILNAITLPLRIVTFGLFSMVTGMAMIWLLDLMFAEAYIPWLFPLLYTTLIIWGLNIIFGFFLKNNE